MSDALLKLRHRFGEPIWATEEHLNHVYLQSRITAADTPAESLLDDGAMVEYDYDRENVYYEVGSIAQEEMALAGLHALYSQLYFLDRAASAIPQIDHIAPVVEAIERAVEVLAPGQDFQPLLRTI